MVLLFLAQGVEIYEAAAFVDVIAWNNAYGSKPLKLVTAGLRDSVVCTGGILALMPVQRIQDLDLAPFTCLAIPGGFEQAGFYEDAYDDRFLEIIREFDRSKRLIASVCVGALPVGKSGVLKNRRATTYKSGDNRRRSQLAEFGVEIIDEKMVVDRNIITSTGPSSAIEVALKMLELLSDKNNSDSIRSRMGY